jgi:FKBP-type peptidyl-prolyl cis-trans isomerase FkpA
MWRKFLFYEETSGAEGWLTGFVENSARRRNTVEKASTPRRWQLHTIRAGHRLQSPFYPEQEDNTMPITTTNSGLQYEDTVAGDGAEAKAGQYVTVHYTGWLQNDDGSQGAKFDSSKDRNDPFQFPLGAGNVIKGWDEGVQGMKVGGARRLIIPASLGYGARGAGGVIPPNATLIFDVELLGV